MTAAFPMIERALKQLIEFKMPESVGKVGGDLSYDASDDFYIWLGLVGGTTTELAGQWSVDVDIFDSHYSQAMERSLELEAALLARGGHRTSTMVIDNVYQNEIPLERPWDDESAFRVGATYTLTARRRSGTSLIGIPVDVPPPGGGLVTIGFTHVQSTPAATWIVTHNLDGYPYPTIILAGETENVYTDVDYPDSNTLVLSFAEATSGTVYL